MLKKRNIAMVMAAATVATSVAPVFAAVEEVTTVDAEKLLSEVERLLDVKYTDSKETGIDGTRVTLGNEYQNSVYKISVGGTVIKSVEDLRKLIEAADVDGTSIVIDIVDKGHKEVNGEIVAIETNQFTKYQSTDFTASGSAMNTIITTAGHTVAPGNIITSVTGDTSEAVITLANTKEITLTTDDYKLDFTKPVDKDGNLVSVDATGSMAQKVVGFKEITTGKVVENGIPATKLAEVTYTNKLDKREYNISDFKTEDGYTKSGEELVNLLVAANNNSNTTTTIKDGKEYTVTFNRGTATAYNDADITDVKSVEEGGYKVTVQLIAQEENAVVPTKVEIVIKSDSQKELKELRDVMVGGTRVTEGQGGKSYTSLVGDDRFETAIQISKAARPNATGTSAPTTPASAVILVGKDAVVDGLAAAPLSTQKDAPILLSDKDAVSKETLAEMKRVLPTTGTKVVYIVGGENTISTEVEAQLSKELKAKIVRIAGDDRYETSLKIAEELTIGATSTAGDEVFVVGGDGLADAMSIAAVASKSTISTSATPIIVTPKDGLTKDAKHFLDKNTGIDTATVVGGTTKVSKAVLDDLKEAVHGRTGANVSRIAGNDRHETNVKVIDKYYKDDEVRNVFVAQDGYVGGDSKLIDALAVASYAGKQNAPIVLATSDLTQKQADIIEAKTQKHNASTITNTLTKVGGGVASKVMNRVLDILGL